MITSANSSFVLTAPSIYPQGVTIQVYAVDRAVAHTTLDVAETQMGVDGRLTAGYTPQALKQTITIQADSPSKKIFDDIYRYMKVTREIISLSAVLSIPGAGYQYIYTNGFITRYKVVPDLEKVLSAIECEITWERVDPSIMAA